MIQEPWIGHGQVRGFGNKYSKVIWNRGCDNPRSCIVIRNNIEFTCVSELMTRDLVTLQCHINMDGKKKTIVIASAYCDGGIPTPLPELIQLVEYCSRKKLPLLLSCDANAHHTEWGSTDINSRGEFFLEFIVKNNLEIMNIGNTPTFVTTARKEVLDVTIASSALANYINRWQVSAEPSLSDHRIITFELENVKNKAGNYRNPKRTNWINYNTTLTAKLSYVSTAAKNPRELEIAVKTMNEAIIEAYEESCPRKTHHGVITTPWWNKTLTKLRKQVRQQFNCAKHTGCWQDYKEVLYKYNKEIRRAKRDSFREFCSELTSMSAGSRVYKAMANCGTLGASSLRMHDGNYTHSEPQRLKLLLETHFPGCVPREAETRTKRLEKPTQTDWNLAKAICTRRKLEWAVESFQAFKSPGTDGIFPALLQKGKELILPHMVRICRSSLAYGYIPEPWRRAKVVFIPKAGKRDTSAPKSYRPISLTSFMLKAMEKTVDNYIRCIVLEKNPLHPCQHAYRAGRSTDTALYQLTNLLKDTAENNETALCVFTDIEGCFDNTSHLAIEEALQTKKVPPTIIKWVKEALNTRIAEAEGVTVRTTRGCPQGGVLSPLLWSLVVDRLLQNLTEQGISCIGYADDVVAVVRGKFDSTLCDLLQNALTIISKWCKSVGLKLNIAKTCIIPFTSRRKTNFRQISIEGNPLEWKKEIKYLGVTLDSKLTFSKHIEETVSKATRALMICRRLAGKNWGCTPKILRQMYLTIVRPITTYGCVVWANRVSLETNKKILSRVQRLACVSITGAMKSCPTAAMEIIVDLPPLHFAVMTAAKLATVRIINSWNSRSEYTIRRDNKTLSRCSYLLEFPTDRTSPKFTFERDFETIINSKDDSGETTLSLPEHAIKWYTDGSKTKAGAGVGIVGPRTKIKEALGKEITIYQAEMYALDRCIQLNIDRDYRLREIAIMTDSQAAIKALSACTTTSQLVWECRRKLDVLSKRNKVTLVWVPGHAGISGNEKADQLAKEGAATSFVGPEPFCGVGNSLVRQRIKEQEYKMAADRWTSLPGHRQAKLLLGNYHSKRAKQLINLKRRQLRILTGFLTGHCNLNGHLAKIGVKESGLCRFCERANEDPEHILLECEAITRKRAECLDNLRLSKGDIPSLNPLKILNLLKEIGLEEVL